MAVFQPVGQVRLTNVAVVRLKKKGKRFEVACFPSKVLDWREGVETDIDEVLQTHTIFNNVSKGIAAKSTDLERCFGTTDEDEICELILQKGNVQTSSKERKQQAENKFKDIATIVAEKCINPETERPYTVSMIERAMKDIHYNIKPSDAAKKQALEVIAQLEEVMPIARAKMRLRVELPTYNAGEIKDMLTPHVSDFEEENWGMTYEMYVLIEPGAYRTFDDIVGEHTSGAGTIEVVDLAVVELGEEEFE